MVTPRGDIRGGSLDIMEMEKGIQYGRVHYLTVTLQCIINASLLHIIYYILIIGEKQNPMPISNFTKIMKDGD